MLPVLPLHKYVLPPTKVTGMESANYFWDHNFVTEMQKILTYFLDVFLFKVSIVIYQGFIFRFLVGGEYIVWNIYIPLLFAFNLKSVGGWGQNWPPQPIWPNKSIFCS